MKIRNLIIAFLALMVMLSLAACGGGNGGEIVEPGEPGEIFEPGTFEVTLDADGMASWNAVKDAVGYNACIVSVDYGGGDGYEGYSAGDQFSTVPWDPGGGAGRHARLHRLSHRNLPQGRHCGL